MPVATLRLFVFSLFLTASAAAQPQPGNCTTGTAEALLSVSDVQATVFNTGSLFFGGNTEAAYLVPKSTGKSPIYAAGIWIGGIVDGDLRVAGSTYSNFEFWPGPLGADARPVNPADCSAHDRIWRVSRDDVRHYLRTGEATPDLLDWPHALGAPVLDGDGVVGNYDLEGGDQPAIRGDETAWWLMNDVGNDHDNTGSEPLGVEVQVEAFVVVGPEVPPSGFVTAGRASFYRYLITNKNAGPIDDAYVSLFLDPDLGDAADDYVGTDTLREFGFVYNSDNMDAGSAGYGEAPPAVSFAVLRGPTGDTGEELGMTAGMYFIGGGPPGTSDPTTTPQVYNIMQGLWTNRLPMRECGIGIACGGPITTFAFAGDPTTRQFWSEVSEGNSPGDRRFVVSTGPFRLDPGETEEVTFGIAYGRGGTNLESVQVLRGAAEEARFLYREGYLDPGRVTANGPGDEPPDGPDLPDGVRLARPAPNPFTGTLLLRYEVPAATALRLEVLDARGRAVAVLFDGLREGGFHEATLDGADLAPGVYFVRLSVPGGSRVVPITRAPR